MFTSRGCPYQCTFCSSSRYWGKTRFFSAEYVVDEIEYLWKTYHVSMISFFDDLFIAKRSRLEQMIRLMERRNLLGKIQFTCNSRANLIDDEMARLLSRLGVVSSGFGMESGDEETLRYLKCTNISVNQNQAAINTMKKAGIAVNASFIIGSPNESRKSIMRTYDFIRNSKLDLFDVYILTPFPGTPVWDYAKQRGIVSEDDFDWSRLSVNVYRNPEKAIILSETLSKEEIIGLYKRLKRLRLLRSVIRVWNHPLRKDVPRYIWARTVEFIMDSLCKKRSSFQ
jgi:anaerobic magnesium-protoporphyrin IX monomethyl ester cyclase